ncbi:hypothetical protein TNCV_4502281 [Trichonephila clavipes]|nr:hypothetical protein TNCV_4502281 [Trichonephila clavipes]
MSSRVVPLKTHRVEVPLHIKSIKAQTFSRWCEGEVRKGECQLRCRRSRDLTEVQIYEDRVTNGRHVALQCDPRLPSGQGMGSYLACHDFEPCTPKYPPCKGEIHVKSVESGNVLPLVWCGS